MNTKKIKTVSLVFLFLVCGLFCLYSQENSLFRKTIYTEHFDIIYQAPSEKTAFQIASQIEKMYEDIRKECNAEKYFKWKHFPVIIKYSTQSLNASYSEFPYRMIIFYDTIPTDSLSVFSDNVYSVLYHELTHAVTFNTKGAFSKFLTDVIMDGWSNGFFTTPRSLTEGLAVAHESMTGEGRLNDVYSTQIIKQAKIENRFPFWDEITGSYDLYTSDSLPYIFGGAFWNFVIDKYGMELFSKYWHKLINGFMGNYFTYYKKFFKTDFTSDYLEFVESIKIPDVTCNPCDTDGISDFFTVTDRKKKNLERNEMPVSFITGQKNGIVWIKKDSSDVCMIEFDRTKLFDSDEDIKKCRVKKLFTLTGIYKIHVSSDGRYVFCTRFINMSEVKTQLKIFDIEKNRFVKTFSNCFDGTLCNTENGYVLCLLKSLSQNYSYEFYSVDKDFKSCDGFSKPFKTIDSGFKEYAVSVSDAGNGCFAFTKRAGLKNQVVLFDAVNDETHEISIPENITLRDVNGIIANGFYNGQSGNLLTFSYSLKDDLDTLPRLGFISVKKSQNKTDCNLYLCKKDFSGGIHHPAAWIFSESRKLPSVVYQAKMYDASHLYVLDSDKFEFDVLPLKIEKQTQEKNLSQENKYLQFNIDKNRIKNYNPFPYSFDGVFIPLGTVLSSTEKFDYTGIHFAGLTWIAKNWYASAGYNPLNQTFGANLNLHAESETQAVKYSLGGTCIFDINGFKQTREDFSFEAAIPVLNHSFLVFSESSQFFYGYSNPLKFTFTPDEHSVLHLRMHNVLGIYLNTIRKTGMDFFQSGGIDFGPFVSYTLQSVNNGKIIQGINCGFDFNFKLPKIIPVDNPSGLTCNLPLTVNLRVAPNIDRFFDFGASVVLFSKEVQKGTKTFFIPLYLNRFYIRATYYSSLYYNRSGKKYYDMALFSIKPDMFNECYYSDYVGLRFDLMFSINTGSISQLGSFDVNAELIYKINPKAGENRFSLKVCSFLVF